MKITENHPPLIVLLLVVVTVFLGAALPVWAESRVPFELPPSEELGKLKSGVLSTSAGKVYFELFPEDAPWHVANFKYLADKGFYRDRKFHLYHEGYIIQGGSPSDDPNGGPGYSLPPEFNSHHHEVGAIAMARLPDSANPQRRSNGSQFYFVLGNATHLDGSFTVFGRVVKGMENVYKLRKGDRIYDLTVYVRDDGRGR